MKQLTRMIAALCLFVTLLVLRELPAEIPAHYDFAGNVTRYGSKYELLILPVILLLVSFGSRFLLLHFHRKAEQAESDKERQAAEANAKVLGIVIFPQILILSCIQGVLLYNTVRCSCWSAMFCRSVSETAWSASACPGPDITTSPGRRATALRGSCWSRRGYSALSALRFRRRATGCCYLLSIPWRQS